MCVKFNKLYPYEVTSDLCNLAGTFRTDNMFVNIYKNHSIIPILCRFFHENNS